MVKIGVLLPTREAVMYGQQGGSPLPLIDLAVDAEQAGFDSVWAGDSLLAKPRAEPLSLLAAVASQTEQVALGTAVLLSAMRTPEQLAQQAATVDAISGGRLILGIGAGPGAPNVRADFDRVGADFDRRSSQSAEVVQQAQALWRGDSEQMYPLTERPQGPPVWVGGEGPRNIERAAQFADGWFPISASVEKFASGLAQLREAAARAGRSDDDLTIGLYLTIVIGEQAVAQATLADHSQRYYGAPHEVISKAQGSTAGDADHVGEWMQTFVDAGADHLCVRFASPNPQEQLERFAPVADGLRSAAS